MRYTDEFWHSAMGLHGSASAMARATGIKYQTVYWNLKKLGICSGPKAASAKKNLEIPQNELIEKYKELKSLIKLGEYYGVNCEGLRKRIPTRLLDKNRCAKIRCNEAFFAADNELSFYYAGFLAADGCLKLKGGKYKQIQFSLSAADAHIVRRFAEHIEYGGEVKEYTIREKRANGTPIRTADLQISSDQLFDDLHRFGLTQRKSLTYVMPKWLTEHRLVHHFIRGYFDGDGSAYITRPAKNRTIKQVYISVRGTEKFLSQMRTLFDVNVINGRWKRNKKIRFNNGIGVLEYGGNASAVAIAEYMYRDATIWMERKRDKFDLIPELTAQAQVARSRSRLGKPNIARRRPIIAININTGENINLTGAPEAVERFALSYSGVRDCLSGRQKQHRGWTFRY